MLCNKIERAAHKSTWLAGRSQYLIDLFVCVKCQNCDCVYEDPWKVWGGPKDDENNRLFCVGCGFPSPYLAFSLIAMLITKKAG